MILSDKQKKRIVAEYAEGNISQSALSKKYKVARATIQKVIKENAEFSQKVAHIKKENAQSVLEHVAKQKDAIINLFDETTKQLSIKVCSGEADVRELVGLFKTIIETYANVEAIRPNETEQTENKIIIEVVDNGKDTDK